MKPILFNTEMVKAILDGRKTVTRRVAFKADELREFPCASYPDGWWFRGRVYANREKAMNAAEGIMRLCKYRPGDILWVRETFRIDYLSNIPGTGRVQYKDETYMDIRFHPDRYEMMRRAQRKPGWRPNENMPREAARIFLRVSDVRVERLQDITLFDMDAEGRPICDGGIMMACSPGECIRCDKSLENSIPWFQRTWDSTIKPADLPTYGWEANPWVWVIEFEVCEKTEA